ncbi:hypothetical protein [Pseudonocardia acaciae]|uniref:hypothetical protein n=1 Tax=Pseudonocardia acaciae TaxID=551276 RepID=UPI00048F8B3B|nr:hypothetical protein [Pseudonocardia acaciae]
MTEPPVSSERLVFALLPDITDRHVHAVYDPADVLPLSLCGLNILPDLYLPTVVILCGRCMALRPDNATLYPATSERRAYAQPAATWPAALGRWWRGWRYDGRVRRALVVEQRRHG